MYDLTSPLSWFMYRCLLGMGVLHYGVVMKVKPCGNCGLIGHNKLNCWQRKRKAVPFESPKSKSARLKVKSQWFIDNPLDEDGRWPCYLQISYKCLQRVDEATITLEHVRSKVDRPDLKFEVLNIKASCPHCNKLKGGKSIEELAEEYPHLIKVVEEFHNNETLKVAKV